MKKCPYCAEEIQDEAVVCKHCGRELGPLPKVAKAEYEFADFIYIWPESEREWTYIAKEGEAVVRLNAWQNAQQTILSKLQPLLDDGWEPIGELGPGSITIIWENANDSTMHLVTGVPNVSKLPYGRRVAAQLSCRYWSTMLLLAIGTILTVGIILIPLIIIVAQRRYCTPEKFQMKLRRIRRPAT